MAGNVGTNSTAGRTLTVAGAAMLMAIAVALTAAGTAGAAFPGTNGNILFHSNRDVGAGEIYAIPPGGEAVRITTSTGSSDPVYSPDGSRIAFISTNPGGAYQVFLMNADGSGRTQLTTGTAAKLEPAFSPDGTQVAFVANSFDTDGQTDLEIWAIGTDGTGLRQITSNTVPDTSPAWSPAGDRIAFVSTNDVFAMTADGGGRTNLTPDSPPGCSPTCYQGGDSDPAWAPDGTRIAYVHGHTISGGGLPDIWTMAPDGGGKLNVSNNDAVSFTQPAYSPQGDKLAVVGAVDTNRDIWVMNADGSGQAPLESNPAHDINPDWGPPAPLPDDGPPDTMITGGPSGLTNSASPSFTFSSTEAGSSFECRLDATAFAPCTSPKTFTGLSQGAHTVQVRAKDPAGNIDPSPASRSFTVDTTTPNTTITKAKINQAKHKATFRIFSSEPGSTFRCKLDKKAFAPCRSPKTYKHLKRGKHKFQVRAVDKAGNIDSTPAVKRFKIKR